MKKTMLILALYGASMLGTTACSNSTKSSETEQHKGDHKEDSTHHEGDGHNHDHDSTHHTGDGHNH